MSLIFRAGQKVRYPQVQALASCKNIVDDGGTGTRTLSNFGTFPGTSSVSFTKYDGDSRLRVDFHVTLYFPTPTPDKAEFSVLISGVDYVIASMPFITSSSHKQCSAVAFIPGIAAGTYTVQVRWRRVSGAGTMTSDLNDYMSMLISECQE